MRKLTTETYLKLSSYDRRVVEGWCALVGVGSNRVTKIWEHERNGEIVVFVERLKYDGNGNVMLDAKGGLVKEVVEVDRPFPDVPVA